MRKPQVVSQNLLKLYLPSSDALDLIGESQRQILPENFEWNIYHIKTLKELCVHNISKNFEKYPEIITRLPCENRDHLLDILSTDLAIECAIIHINEEHYWKRRYEANYGTMKIRKCFGWSWKNAFLERYVQEILENAQPQYDDEQVMADILTLCEPYVERLIVSQLQIWKPPLTMEKEKIPLPFQINHIDFQFVLCDLSNITEVAIVIGMNDVGETFHWNMFEVSIAFFQRLGRALLDLNNLIILRIHRCKMEYPHCQALIQNIIKNQTISILDISNCELGDEGALCVAKFLMNHTELQKLILMNDNIRQKGAEGIGFALMNLKQKHFECLNLRLNPLGRGGTMGIFRALVRCSNPKILSLSACLFEKDIPERIGQVIKMNESLKELDISNNRFGTEGGDILVDALKENSSLEVLDVRKTGITFHQEEKIKKYLIRNKTGVEESPTSNIKESDTS